MQSVTIWIDNDVFGYILSQYHFLPMVILVILLLEEYWMLWVELIGTKRATKHNKVCEICMVVGKFYAFYHSVAELDDKTDYHIIR